MQYRRNRVPGGTYFFTLTLADRSSRFLVDCVEPLRQAFREARSRRPFMMEAVVVLPDHLQCIWRLPEGDDDYPARWRAVKSGFTRKVRHACERVREVAGGGYDVWQRRYWEHTIRDERDWRAHVDYIHYNPVKHGHVLSRVEWTFSSIHRFIALRTLAPDWGAGFTEAGNRYGE